MNTKRLWGKIAFLGLGFFALGPVNGLYDAYVPTFLTQFLSSSILIGLIMGIDNLIGFFFFPWFGALSDRTTSRFGRRRPFVLIGLPLTALGMAALPFGRELGLPFLILASLLMNFAVTICRPTLLAMMPDITPSAKRPVGFGILTSLLGIGSIVGIGAGRVLYETNPRYPFLFAAGLMLAVSVVFMVFLREPAERQTDHRREETPQRMWQSLKAMITNPDRMTLFLFLGILLVFMCMQSVTTWFTVYSAERFNLPVNEASQGLIALGLMLVLGSIPAGYLGAKFGRRRIVVAGLVGMIFSLVVLFLAGSLPQAIGGMILFGITLMLVMINTYPMVLELCEPREVGMYSGLFYMCQYGAGVLGPTLLGVIFDLSGSRRPMFLVIAVFAMISLALLLQVRKGTAEARTDFAPAAPAAKV